MKTVRIIMKLNMKEKNMKVSIKSLEKMSACKDGIDWYKKNNQKTLLETLEKAETEKHLNYFNWYISRKLSHLKKVEYAIFAAEQVIDLFEIKYPNDNRPRLAIEAAKNFIKDPTEENKEICRKAAYAANAAANAYAADAYSANAAYYADANKNINFVKIVEKSMKY